MDKKQVLEILRDRSCQRLFGCSANYLMTKPKRGLEAEFQEEREILDVLENLMEEWKNPAEKERNT